MEHIENSEKNIMADGNRHPEFTFDKSKKETEGSFVNDNGIRIACKYWSKHISSPRGLVFICHGAAEHCGPYTELAQLITEQNYFVFGHDHQGHGQSEGSRVHIDDFRHYSRDVFLHTDRVKQDFPDLPVFIIGHSMGGAVTIIAGIDRPNYFKGIVLIGPVTVSDNDQVGPVKIFLGKLVARVFPHFPVLKLDSKHISRDPKAVEAYEKDPHNYHGACKAKWGTCVLKATEEIVAKMSSIEWPFLCIHGELDALVKCSGSRLLYEKAASKDKTLTVYQGAYHQLHLEIEPDKSKALKEIVDWIVHRTS